MNEKELEALRVEYLSAAEPIRRRIEDLQARVNSVRGKERIATLKRIASLTDDLWTLTDGARRIQDSLDGHTKIIPGGVQHRPSRDRGKDQVAG